MEAFWVINYFLRYETEAMTFLSTKTLTLTAMTNLATYTEANHLHFLPIPLVRRMIHLNSFFFYPQTAILRNLFDHYNQALQVNRYLSHIFSKTAPFTLFSNLFSRSLLFYLIWFFLGALHLYVVLCHAKLSKWICEWNFSF